MPHLAHRVEVHRKVGSAGQVLCVLVKIKLHAVREPDYPALYLMNQSACVELTNQDKVVWKRYFNRTLGSAAIRSAGQVLCVLVKIKLHAVREPDYPALYLMNQSACVELTNQDKVVWKRYFNRTLGSACAPQF
ncbi:hypothetical protein M513_09018 [Trichuris suis]|uniref:Uncharacterized protein n=1 Tax=Trichuris suis TaxID=68888 RepID=A0A085LYL2_9BILA|nr:hypothetical protein M513_09018 [Trichuris suis]